MLSISENLDFSTLAVKVSLALLCAFESAAACEKARLNTFAHLGHSAEHAQNLISSVRRYGLSRIDGFQLDCRFLLQLRGLNYRKIQ